MHAFIYVEISGREFFVILSAALYQCTVMVFSCHVFKKTHAQKDFNKIDDVFFNKYYVPIRFMALFNV